MTCPHCSGPLAMRSLVEYVCAGCDREYWLRGAELVPGRMEDAPASDGDAVPRATARIRPKKS